MIPSKIADWAKNIFTQVRPWGETNGMKWKMIINEAENPDNNKYGFVTIKKAEARILEESMMITKGIIYSPHTDTTKTAEPPPSSPMDTQLTLTKGYILSQQYLSPANNNDYVAVGPENVEK